ncbi:zinc-binding dehydrogenase [Prauserella cavernicola]|uniref:Zinc-binding dehydrogenase n=1 Tax=Prauserella cavernicola TaxID=2800127 RepID=A0A934V6W5_9PSEU|nr:zinc-binding dehydrogenase [Prauserella cavernicola]MBK1786640.1 zinc-binding dehydrogenase [Prauserella cavernicola]
MRAISIRTFGAPEGLHLVDLPDPEPAAGQVLIGTEAIGVAGVDVVVRRGTLGDLGFREGHIPGSEVAGTVLAVGEGVGASWIGRRVWAFTGVGGAYVERAVADAGNIIALPDDLSAVDAATIAGSASIAHFGLSRTRFAAGESVLVRGAAGSIGIAAVQLAARGGAAAVAVTTSSAERGARLRELGATHVLDRAGNGEAPLGYDVIIDIVAGEAASTFLRRLNPNGRMVTLGVVGGPLPADLGVAVMTEFQKSLTFMTFSADTVPADELRAVRSESLVAAARGELVPVVHEVLTLENAASAHRKMDEGEVFGRVVLVP